MASCNRAASRTPLATETLKSNAVTLQPDAQSELSPTKAEATGPWFGFIVLEPFIGGCGPEFRDSQMAALTINYTGYASAIDIGECLSRTLLQVAGQVPTQHSRTVHVFPPVQCVAGDPTSPFVSYHPRAKQIPGARLFAAAYSQIYGATQPARMPRFKSAMGTAAGGVMTVTVSFTPGDDMGPLVVKTRSYQDVCPTNGGVPASECGWPSIQSSTGSLLNATLSVSTDGSQLIFTAPAAAGATPVGVQYAYSQWPVITVYSTATVKTPYEEFDFPLDGFKATVTPTTVAIQ